MRILFFGNNRLSCKILTFLRESREEIVGLVVHPESKQRYGRDLVECSNLEDSRIFSAETLNEPETIKRIRALDAELGISVLFGYILKKQVLELFPKGSINLHPALLPYNRGAYPNVWSIVDGTPAGVTLHFIDEGVDTGDIIAQHEVPVLPTDTGKILYERLELAAAQVFREAWPSIKLGTVHRRSQEPGGTSHRVRDVEEIDEIKLDEGYTAKQLIDILRARTFSPYKGAYFVHEGRRIYLSLSLTDENDLE